MVSKIASPEDVQKAILLQDLYANFKPIPWQIKFGQALFRDGKKRIFLQNARKSGKTEAAVFAMVRWALENPNTHVLYCAPFRIQAQELIFSNNRLRDMVPAKYIAKISKSELRVTFINGSWIKLAGADNPDSLRGIEPHLLILDEVANISEQFILNFLPNLTPHKAPAIYMGTPPALAGIYNKLAEECQADPNSFWIQVKTADNPHIDPGEIERERLALFARGEHDVFSREYEGRFVTGGSKAIFPMLDKRHLVPFNVLRERVDRDVTQLQWYVSLDPGNSTVFGGLIAAHNPFTQENFVFGEIYETRSTHTSISNIMAQVKVIQDSLNLPASIDWNWIVDNAAAWARAEIMERDPTIFCEATRKMENPKESGLSLMKDLFSRDKLLIATHCKHFYKELLNYVKDDNGNIPKKNDHLIDAARYFLGSAGCALGPDTTPNPDKPAVEDQEEVDYFPSKELDRPLYSFEEEEEYD